MRLAVFRQAITEPQRARRLDIKFGKTLPRVKSS